MIKTNEKTAGVDEVGRGCLAGPVVAACVIMPSDWSHKYLNDSKKVTEKRRNILYDIILEEALYHNISSIDVKTIDNINILESTYLAMNESISESNSDLVMIDGNQFKNTTNVNYECVIKGDTKYVNIASASIIAKVYRDRLMTNLSEEFPDYDWKSNKGYGTKKHIEAIKKFGITEHHRKTFLGNII